ncbi:Yip1 family protein [Caulobacter mirabilis]|nr:Yip1 family protein [Caulobacter mirabilis]
MSVVDGGSSSGLVQRVQDILLRPKPTWDAIDGEPATVKGLYTGYVMILAALPPIATILGNLLLAPLFGGYVAFTLIGTIVMAVLSYGLALVGVYVFALVVDALAPSFDGTRSQIQAFKGVAYGATAAWVGGGLGFVPIIGWLIAIAGGIYSLYLFYLGLPKMMKVPEQKALGFTAVAIILAVVIQAVIGWVASAIVITAGLGAVGAANVAATLGGLH